MIQFPCHCGHVFNVTDDQTGDDIQCPACGRLNSVPTTADLALLNHDGTYKVDAPIGPEVPDADREEQLKYIFQKSRIDEHGREIDLRSHATPLDYQRVGVDPIDILPEGDRPAAPKYDPETGELIRPMEIRKDPMQNVRRVLPPMRPRKSRKAFQRLTHVNAGQIFLELFKTPNVIVMSIVLCAHIGLLMVAMIPVLGLILMFPGFLMIAFLMTAHFGNVIDETGPSSRDELPRPLRDLNWNDDMWGPVRSVIISSIVCYIPALLILMSSIPNLHIKLVLAGGYSLLGTLIAPAVLLTAMTSGSIANLRPDRLIGTLKAMGGSYALAFALMIVAVPTYAFGLLNWLSAVIVTGAPQWMTRSYVALPVLIAGIFLLHYFAWTMGHIYRVYHRYFPWVNQGAVRDDEAEPRGFAVVPPTKTQPPVSPLPVSPLPAMPVHAATREERLDRVRESDAVRKKESDEMIRNIPDSSRYHTGQYFSE